MDVSGNTTTIAAGTNLGSFAWFDFDSVRVTAHTMRTLLVDNGFGDLVDRVKEADPVQNLRNIARRWAHGRFASNDRFRAEVVDDRNDSVVVGILRRVRVTDAEVAWEQVADVKYDRTAGWAAPNVATNPDGTMSADGAAMMAEFLRYATPRLPVLGLSKVRGILLHVILRQWSGFSLRQQGGIYYVPRQYRADLPRLRAVVAGIGSAALKAAHVEAGAESASSIADSARTSIGDRIAEVRERVAAWKAEAKKVRGSSADRAIAELVAIRNDADLIADSLGVALDDVRDVVADAVREIRAVVDGTDAPAQDAGPAVPDSVLRLRSKTDDELAAIHADLVGEVAPGTAREDVIASILAAA